LESVGENRDKCMTEPRRVAQANGVANLSRDWSQLFVDVTVAADHPSDRAIEVLAEACADFRSDPDWAAALVDGPRVLGVESLTLGGVTLRIQLRTAPTRQHDLA